MRMRNPFSDEPGDEEKGSGDAPAEAEQAQETRESEGPQAQDTRESEGPRMTEEHADEGAQATASDEQQSEEPQAQGDSDATDSDEGGSGGGDSDSEHKETADIAAPSIGPNTVIEREPPEERLDHDKISDKDAMGQDKRREVIGGTYGPTRTRVIATFATFIAVVAALSVGFYFLAQELDQPPSENPDESPWSLPDAPQQPPKPIQ